MFPSSHRAVKYLWPINNADGRHPRPAKLEHDPEKHALAHSPPTGPAFGRPDGKLRRA
jgi:hypothetical protein